MATFSSSTKIIGNNNSGSFSGSFQGNGWGLTNITSASYAVTASYAHHANTADSASYVPASIPTGVMLDWGGTISTVPSGWLHCDGSAISRTTYATLFNVIGIQWGSGDNSTTFNLPNSMNKFAVGADVDSGGTSKSTITGAAAKTGGSTTSSGGAHTHTSPTYTLQNAINTGNTVGYTLSTTNSTSISVTVIPPFFACAKIIKT